MARIDAHEWRLRGAHFSPDGRFVVTYAGGDYAARVFDAETGTRVFDANYDDRLHRAAFSPDGQHLRVEGQNGTQVWNMRGELLFSLK